MSAERREPASPDRRREPRGGRRATDRPGRAPLVLLVDPHDAHRDLYDVWLAQHNFAVALAGAGPEAVTLAERLGPGAVVTELRLPGIDGVDLVRRLRTTPLSAAIPIVMFTAETRPRELARARAAGCTTVVVKPCMPDVLIESLRLAFRIAPAALPAQLDDEGLVQPTDERLRAIEGRGALGTLRPIDTLDGATRPNRPRSGDILLSRTRTGVTYQLAVVPGPAQLVEAQHAAAIARARAFAAERRVNAWYSEDSRHFLLLASFRPQRTTG